MVNSRGGSPVYSSMIGQRILSFVDQHKVPYYTFAEDVAASGGQWLISSGHYSYASANSLVGSIGVISGQAAARKILSENQISQTHVTTSENLIEYKLNPMRVDEVSDENVEWSRRIQDSIFVEFEKFIRKQRGDKLDQSKLEQIFSADVFSGVKAKELGLIDEIGLCEPVMKEKFPGVEIKNFSKKNVFEDIQQNIEQSTRSMVGKALLAQILRQ